MEKLKYVKVNLEDRASGELRHERSMEFWAFVSGEHTRDDLESSKNILLKERKTYIPFPGILDHGH